MSIQVRSNDPTPTQPATEIPKSPETETEKAAAHAEQSAPEANTSEQKDGAEQSESPAKEEKEAGETEARESEQDTEAKEETTPEDKKPKKGGFQKRVDKLNARIADKEREAEYWKQEALKRVQATETKPAVETTTSSGEPDPAKFEAHSEYVKAVAKWAAAEERKSLKAEQEKEKFQSAQQELVSTYLERKEAFSEKAPDFDEVISEVDDIQVSPAVRDIILNSEHGPELAYQLAKNRKEYERICSLPPLTAAKEMGKLEDRLATKTSAPETKKITNAPKPLSPVGTGGKGAVRKSIEDIAAHGTQAEYEAARAEEKKRRQAG